MLRIKTIIVERVEKGTQCGVISLEYSAEIFHGQWLCVRGSDTQLEFEIFGDAKKFPKHLSKHVIDAILRHIVDVNAAQGLIEW